MYARNTALLTVVAFLLLAGSLRLFGHLEGDLTENI
jgi:hypothetical protein